MENRPYREKTDEELTIICEDEQAFGELARRYQSIAFRIAFCMLRNRCDAEDQVQSAFCKAFQHVDAFGQRSKFSTWLVRIVVNECLMQLRRVRTLSPAPFDEFASECLSVQDASWSPEAAMEQVLLRRVIHREIRRIPPLLRNVVLLRDVQGESMEATAAQLGISVAAAKSRLSRARQELRRRLEPRVLEHTSSKPLLSAASASHFTRKEISE